MNSPRTIRLSEHFSLTEFKCHDGTPVPPSAIPALQRLCRDFLEPMREHFGPVRITSGYRPLGYNLRIGSTAGSYHVYDLRVRDAQRLGRLAAVAADCVPARGDAVKWAHWARKWRTVDADLARGNRGGVGCYPRSGFVHVDTGPRRDWSS